MPTIPIPRPPLRADCARVWGEPRQRAKQRGARR